MRRLAPLFLALASIFTLAVNIAAAGTTVSITPTTTLQTETANNTSAPDAISTYTKGIAASGNISKMPYRETMYANANTKVYTTLLGWFGKSSHISVGYNSQDPVVVGKQITDMLSRGIDGTFLAWYGADSYEDGTAKVLRQQSEIHPGFNFAIMIDHGTITWDSRGLSATDALIYHMNYVAQNYYSSPAYMHVNGRPVLMEFGLELENIDWTKVSANIQGNPLIIFRNSVGFTRPMSAGGYAWGPADSIGYLTDFYWNALQYPGEITFGGSAKGFNDSLASWTANRYVSEQCGQTWLSSIKSAGSYYSPTNQLPFMMIATWNDYEEGTTIESGIDNCVSLSASATSNTLVWSLSGNGLENTVDHYTVFISSDGQNLMKLADLPLGARSMDLSGYTFNPGTYQLYVKAVAKSSLKNQMSNAATFSASAQSPIASLSVTPTSGIAPVTVTASTAGSSSPNGSITASTINFGDGYVASGTTVSHIYNTAGTYSVTATVTDSSGFTASATASVTVSAPITVSGAVTISQPANLSTVTSAVRVAASGVSTNPIDGMWIYVDDVGVYNIHAASLDTSLSISTGTHKIQVKAWDIYGNIYQSTVTVTVVAPSIVISSPTSSNTSRSFTINAKAYDGKPIASMIAYIDNSEVGRVYSNSMSLPATVTKGRHKLLVRAWEDVTGTVYQSSITFTAQ